MNYNSKNKFEDLPDELILLICRYLNIVEILNGFSCLNCRLSKTIKEFSERIDLNIIPSKLINRFLNEILPDISWNVRSIMFSDNFKRCPIKLEMFNNLESIHFSNSFSKNFLFNIKEIKIDLVPVDIQFDLIKMFFSSNEYTNLKRLVLLSFHGFTFSNIQLNQLNQFESLTITLKNNVDLFELLYLLSSSIEELNIHILYNGPFKPLRSFSSALKLIKLRYFHLKTTFEDSIKFKQLEKLIIDSCSSLEYLSIETLTRDQDYIDGYQWEKFLNKLFYLKKFTFSIRYRFKINENDDQKMKEDYLLKSFSTDFWLKQRKWFINFYSTCSFTNENFSLNGFKRKNYEKLFLHTIPYPYALIDATIDINRTKSTNKQYSARDSYSNVRHLYYDGESIPIQIESLKIILDNFKSINELKLDRLIIDYSSLSSNTIIFRHLNKLTIYNTDEKIHLNINFLNLSSMYNLRYIRIPQISLPDYSKMPKQLETLVLTECRDLQFDYIHKYENLRLLKLYLNNFDRLLENNGHLIMNLINSIYYNNKIMETLQLMCHGVNQRKLKTFEKQFNLNTAHYLNSNYNGKCLTIERFNEYFNQIVEF
ncbi:unnamed protein product [Rotaria socialis]|uniref:F-box domain-containing protein n=1 Tax=Rotaria socialis TaxID=392032 RepID=A0A820IMA1_9BILA|nr:unnamed protein product [Rotaria socialis]CAF3395928.1 unnamed protein product [Rotaria socialis]CAF3456664.1 unnamed protein product [Rotaria socialis]CAF3591626.1 unnamed protein product [Rotaria socialis]CAF3730081.1 unnamed protein product [Rotaria socialis]